MNDWQHPTIIQDSINALQIPDAVLESISTAGLLETCLEYPYLIEIFFSNDYKYGFETGLVAGFNGYRELLKRHDLAKKKKFFFE